MKKYDILDRKNIKVLQYLYTFYLQYAILKIYKNMKKKI